MHFLYVLTKIYQNKSELACVCLNCMTMGESVSGSVGSGEILSKQCINLSCPALPQREVTHTRACIHSHTILY